MPVGAVGVDRPRPMQCVSAAGAFLSRRSNPPTMRRGLIAIRHLLYRLHAVVGSRTAPHRAAS